MLLQGTMAFSGPDHDFPSQPSPRPSPFLFICRDGMSERKKFTLKPQKLASLSTEAHFRAAISQ